MNKKKGGSAMHSFLKAIGFQDMTKKEVDQLLNDIIANPDRMEITTDSSNTDFAIIQKSFGESFGIYVCGEYLENESFQAEYYFPYFIGKGITTQENVDVEKHAEKESYAGICDEIKLGVTLIFYLQNVAEYLAEKKIRNKMYGVTTTLSALSLGGKILLPINKDEKQIRNIEKNSQNRTHLIAAAREGDEDAIENLTLEDIDLYSMLSKRIVREDILSIVDTYFMPYGIESDQYSVLGEIIDFHSVINSVTGLEVYNMTIDCNDLVFDVCVQAEDILGEPVIGRRFKGNIWMQGHLNYQD